MNKSRELLIEVINKTSWLTAETLADAILSAGFIRKEDVGIR